MTGRSTKSALFSAAPLENAGTVAYATFATSLIRHCPNWLLHHYRDMVQIRYHINLLVV